MSRPVTVLDPAGTLAGIYMALVEIRAVLEHVVERLDMLEDAVFDGDDYQPATVDVPIRDGLL